MNRRQLLLQTLSGAGALGLVGTVRTAVAANSAGIDPFDPRAVLTRTTAFGITPPTGKAGDFDFLAGHWTLRNRRLKTRWTGSDDWDVFPATLRCESRMHGAVNIDEGDFPTQGFSGMTVRVFDPATQHWALYWINSSRGGLTSPMVGGFNGDRGEFYGDYTDNGRPVVARYIWRRDLVRWEQAFSPDGKTWETNWIIEHTPANS
ncbi:MAG TPA: hypothetical protein VH814_18195 [Steroidobacteraceae bacterium]